VEIPSDSRAEMATVREVRPIEWPMASEVQPRAAPASPHPLVWAVLYFPLGLALGFPSVALGYLGSRAGLDVSTVAGIVGMTFLGSGWKFLWAPIGDYTLTRKRWYLIATSSVALGLVAMTVIPLSSGTVTLVSVLTLASTVAATFIAFATEGLLAHNTTIETRGRAAGWFQSGNQFGQTAGGGIGLWLVTHARAPWTAGVGLAGLVLACALPLVFLEEPPRPVATASVADRARDAWRELAGVVRSRAGRVALVLAILPIGTGAAMFLFSSISGEFRASADVVSTVLGVGGGLAIVAGCFAGGRLADRLAKPTAYALSCGLGLVACLAMMTAPRTSAGYAASTLFYTFTLGMVTASFTGLVLDIIGRSAAATKINLFFALNTLFSLGMLRVAGWAHDRWSTNGMLLSEVLAGAGALVFFVVLVRRIPGAELRA
jgi:MFS transporter, PAT family, beta-lactamase induction signal transducer AmpG